MRGLYGEGIHGKGTTNYIVRAQYMVRELQTTWCGSYMMRELHGEEIKS